MESGQDFDVVVVGGGPAGGQCARSISAAGRRVLLVERHRTFDINSFSSAGTPLETLSTYALPESVVGSYWQRLVLVTSRKTGEWQTRQPLGAVLDFGRLRAFLADQVLAHGGSVWMGCRYVGHQQRNGETLVHLQRGREPVTVRARVVVDASGPFRAVMYDRDSPRPEFMKGAGLEYLVEVDPEVYQRYAGTLTFFLGYKWIPRGYSWIFPMEPNRLKIGSGILKARHRFVEQNTPLKHHIRLILDQYIQTRHYKLIEVHGSTLQYSEGLQDIYHRDNLIAIGDAVSTVNFLGGEGIRHGMQCAEIACKHIRQFLDGSRSDFDAYEAEVRLVFDKPWNISEKLGKRIYLQERDEIIDRLVSCLRPLSMEDVVDILFFYRFERIAKGIPHLRRKLGSFFIRMMAHLKARFMKPPSSSDIQSSAR